MTILEPKSESFQNSKYSQPSAWTFCRLAQYVEPRTRLNCMMPAEDGAYGQGLDDLQDAERGYARRVHSLNGRACVLGK